MAKFARYVTTSGAALDPRLRAKIRYIAAPVETTPRLVRWLFLLFIFTFPFETTNLGFMSGFVSMAKLSGLVFFLFYFLYYNPLSTKRSFPSIPSATWWFLGYVTVYVLNLPRVAPEFYGEFLIRLLTLLQIIVFFWICSDLLKDEKLTKRVLLTYAIACAIFSVCVVLRVPGFSQEIVAGRVTAVGENLNALARFMAIAIIILMHLSTTRGYSRFRQLLLASLVLPIAVTMVGTGSRGAVVAFIMGISVYLLPYCKSKRGFTAVLLAAFGIIGVIYTIASTPDLLTRWQESYYERKFSARETIFAVAIEMISEQPLFGWGAVESSYQLGIRDGSLDWTDAHNIFLHLLVEVGLVGTIPFLFGLLLCLKCAWKARLGNLGLLPLALMTLILTGSLSGNTLVWKPLWFIMALAIAAASTSSGKIRRQPISVR